MPYVNDVLAGKRAPGRAILEALGVERVVGFIAFKHNKLRLVFGASSP